MKFTNRFFRFAYIFLDFIVLIGVFFAICITAQKPPNQIEKCRVDSKERVNYKLIFEHRNSLPPYALIAKIVVRQRNYNKEYMQRLAQTLASRYCHDDQISVAIFDDEKAARKTDMFEYLIGHVKVPELRGFYSMDRAEKTSGIVFSTRRGNPPDEIKIDLLLED